MLYLFWTVLNLVVAVYFIGLCFQATRFIKERISLYAALIFAFGLLSFVANSGPKRAGFKGNSNVEKWTFISRDSLAPGGLKFARIKIDETWISEIDLNVFYGVKKSSSQTIPAEAYSVWSGFITGYDWEPTSISVRATNGPNYAYSVAGLLRWKLLGLPLYSQPKSYAGSIELN
ncbi:hypothetical protein GCM10028803_20260 [Larkinella knui]|uniref:Uncharacterized protein n=1 Tax=Larkinella knui TaxID=2025310 RepID=A0A3P1CUT6_9BACT|nr:hypothetical protein [Larkinella knui]RRB17112.1 hypothetical protein EHT87_02195 [Larkinella knui]